MIDVSQKQEQNRLIIQQMDESISICAKKGEIVEYSQELKKYCRDRIFQDFKESCEKDLDLLKSFK